MKVLLLLLMASRAYSQIPVKTNTIIVKGVGFMEACNVLLDKGHSIDKKDNDLQTATTEYKEYVKHWNAEYKINIRIKDSALYITGVVTAPPKTGGLFKDSKLTQEKGAKHLYSVGFGYLNEYAISFGKPVEYLKQ